MQIDTNWKLEFKIQDNYIWAAPIGMGGYMYQSTKVNTPPDTDSGFYSLYELLKTISQRKNPDQAP